MSTPTSTRSAPLLLWAGLPVGLAAILVLVVSGVGPLFVGLALLAILAIGMASALMTPTIRHWLPAIGLLTVLALSLSAQGNDDGVDPFEVLFGLTLIGFLGAWYGTSVVGGTRTLRSATDVATFLFIAVGGLGGLALGLLTSVPVSEMRSDLTCVLAFALFFPVREVCTRFVQGPRLIAGALVGLGLYASGANALRLYGALTGAIELYEVVDIRVASGEIQIVGALIVTALWFTSIRSRKAQTALFVIASFLLAGLILTKSRGAWLTATAGLMVCGVLAGGLIRRRLILTMLGGGLATIAAGLVAVGPQLALIGIGVLRRITSISTAATADISLLNRYAEAAATWEAILNSPILGSGWGAPIVRYDLIVGYTYTTGFVHNGYLWLWHKVGIWGLALFSITLIGTLLEGMQASRMRGTHRENRALAAGATGAIVAYAILAIPSNPYVVLDQMLMVAVTLGLASGLWCRTLRDRMPARAEISL
ncbi:MAG: O-antigen ligase family protein [Bacteroidota bacterium]